MILAISGSPRKDRMIHTALKELLKTCTDPYEIISLHGKRINGCIACTKCAQDNRCKVKDDWNAIGEKMREADIIIFGAPNYYGSINALAHACLERTFAFRHLGGFDLSGKLGISVATQRKNVETNAVKHVIQGMMLSNQMEVIGHIDVDEYSQCYTCGYGHACVYGSVVREHGVQKSIIACQLPNEIAKQERTLLEIQNVQDVLKKRGVNFSC